MIDEIAFALSAGMAQILTNLDNLALLFAVLPLLGVRRAIASYVLAQIIVLGAVFAIAAGASGLLPRWTGYVGVIPIALGLWTLWRRHGGQSDVAAPPAVAGFGLTLVMFLGMSGDSLAVMTPLVIDSARSYRIAVLLGASGAIVIMAVCAALLSRVADRAQVVATRAEAVSPYVMMLAGAYVLWDSATDMV